MKKDTFRVVTRGADGQLHIRDYDKESSVKRFGNARYERGRRAGKTIDEHRPNHDRAGQPNFRGR